MLVHVMKETNVIRRPLLQEARPTKALDNLPPATVKRASNVIISTADALKIREIMDKTGIIKRN